MGRIQHNIRDYCCSTYIHTSHCQVVGSSPTIKSTYVEVKHNLSVNQNGILKSGYPPRTTDNELGVNNTNQGKHMKRTVTCQASEYQGRRQLQWVDGTLVVISPPEKCVKVCEIFLCRRTCRGGRCIHTKKHHKLACKYARPRE